MEKYFTYPSLTIRGVKTLFSSALSFKTMHNGGLQFMLIVTAAQVGFQWDFAKVISRDASRHACVEDEPAPNIILRIKIWRDMNCIEAVGARF